ncbi:pirin family protein [Clostridium sp. 19966]|uniref:pirin family protein n=1 Tax=Clostridium sp. 19966 TaxID=2768166 RepID=UPI0028E02FDC|nr:pirin family protein [Clostridium sp. 19966]MDT8717154.1 pirin family protein [Clostridium sp. 19966]
MIKIVKGQSVKDGAGVKLNRVIGTQNLDMADPFLMLDEFRNDDKKDYEAGFPMHPHRGFETITYMVEGSFTHRDSKGNVGNLNAGEVQWMTAGKGIIHEEMPAMENGHLWGYQLWINLPAKLKMVDPKYRHLTNEIMPIVKEDGINVKIISGEYHGAKGPVELYFDVDYFDVRLSETEGVFNKKVKGTNLVYVHTGKVEIQSEKSSVIEKGNLAVITDASEILVKGKDAGFLFLSADPINEPVAKYGPFVMNTTDELIEAVDDFNEGRFV